MPDGAVYVGRNTRWGNPHIAASSDALDAQFVVATFRSDMEELRRFAPVWFESMIAPLRGKDLACWCALDRPCHADVLLQFANTGKRSDDR